MNLPEEPQVWSKCIRCSQEIYEMQEYVEVAGYHYCNTGCYVELALKEGNITKVVAGG